MKLTILEAESPRVGGLIVLASGENLIVDSKDSKCKRKLSLSAAARAGSGKGHVRS